MENSIIDRVAFHLPYSHKHHFGKDLQVLINGAFWIDQKKLKNFQSITLSGNVESSDVRFRKPNNPKGLFIANVSTPEPGRGLKNIDSNRTTIQKSYGSLIKMKLTGNKKDLALYSPHSIQSTINMDFQINRIPPHLKQNTKVSDS